MTGILKIQELELQQNKFIKRDKFLVLKAKGRKYISTKALKVDKPLQESLVNEDFEEDDKIFILDRKKK